MKKPGLAGLFFVRPLTLGDGERSELRLLLAREQPAHAFGRRDLLTQCALDQMRVARSGIENVSPCQ